MRSALLLLHRYGGLASLAFLAIVAITGCLLTLRAPLDRALNPGLLTLPGGAPIDAPRSLHAVQRFAVAHPGLQVVRFPLNAPAGTSLEVEVAAKPGMPVPAATRIYLDPADARIVGSRSHSPGWDRRHLLTAIAELHANLLAGTWGRWLLGAVALFWFASNLFGLVLTLPERPPFWRRWRSAWRVRLASSMPRLLLDLHRASGLWLLPFLLILAFTSVAFSFWSEAYEPAVTRIAPLERSLFDRDAPFPDGATPQLGFADALAVAEHEARRAGLDWRPAVMLYLPEWNLYGVKFSPHGVLEYTRLGPVDYYIDAADGRFVHQVNPYDDSAGLVMIRMVYPLHSGEILGLATIVLVFVLGVVTLGHAVTGLYIWWRKRARPAAAGRRND